MSRVHLAFFCCTGTSSCPFLPACQRHFASTATVPLSLPLRRYIQLPISAGMPEAWLQPWQELRDGSGGVRQATTLEAAAEVCTAGWGGATMAVVPPQRPLCPLLVVATLRAC